MCLDTPLPPASVPSPARLGVGKVYLWDHASAPPMQSIVQAGAGLGHTPAALPC